MEMGGEMFTNLQLGASYFSVPKSTLDRIQISHVHTWGCMDERHVCLAGVWLVC